MCHTAVMHLPGNFRKVKFIINNKFFYPFDFMCNNKFFNGSALNFRKQICQISIIVI